MLASSMLLGILIGFALYPLLRTLLRLLTHHDSHSSESALLAHRARLYEIRQEMDSLERLNHLNNEDDHIARTLSNLRFRYYN